MTEETRCKVTSTCIATIGTVLGCILWSVMIVVDLLPSWAAYMGGPIVGFIGALWLYPKIRKVSPPSPSRPVEETDEDAW